MNGGKNSTYLDLNIKNTNITRKPKENVIQECKWFETKHTELNYKPNQSSRPSKFDRDHERLAIRRKLMSNPTLSF